VHALTKGRGRKKGEREGEDDTDVVKKRREGRE